MQEPIFSKQYLEWVKANNISGLTNSQHQFAELLLRQENSKLIQTGSFDNIFKSIKKHIKQ